MTEALNTLTSLDWRSANGALVAAAAAATGIYVANRLLTPEDKEAEKFKKLNKLPSPPGALPIIGHLFSVGKSPHIKFSEWSKTLGPIYSVKMGSSRTWVIHNSPEVIREILDRRGATYSDRMSWDVLDAASANGIMWGLAQNGPYLRMWRKHTNNTISKSKLEKEYSQVFITQSKQLLLNLLEKGNEPEGINPSDEMYLYSVEPSVVSHSKSSTSSLPVQINLMSSILFNKTFTKDDPDFKAMIQIAVEFLQILSDVTMELFPFLSPFLRSQVHNARLLQLEVQKVFGKYVEEVRQARKDGNERNCACNEYLKAQETDNENGLMEDIAIYNSCGGLIFAGKFSHLPHIFNFTSATPLTPFLSPGIDTSSIVLLNGISILASHPNIQERAFAEIKDNIGLDRLPRDTDEGRLPYTRAILTEILRFRPPLWLGVPHSNTKDEEYEGYHIPAKSAHVINSYAIHFNPEIYPDPYTFKPERHLEEDVGNIRQHYAFGAGRRICPGSFLAEKSVFILILRIVQVFRIEPPLDAQGNPVEVPLPDVTVTQPGMPNFKVRFVPRHDDVKSMCRDD
ncbi:cytochrome P450 [Jimgerdemannia flammicorona]|uniref:Cytochrome P450 n=1 Tax=Jimgerdemannia flammicorona TaxID=994334 RepID=A0A433D0M2_9FUNG|nr:cytochrome P450 [Jimgerdemannia flammicorona]